MDCSKTCENFKEKVREEPMDINDPNIVLIDADVHTHGKYRTNSGMPRGLVVHYTVSGRSPKRSEKTVKSLAGRGLGCLVMDEYGTIYQGKNQAIDEVAYHAGSSSWKNRSGISRYCLGMEISCYGKMKSSSRDAYGQSVDADEVRYSAGLDNQKKGYYQTYTAAQERALVDFCLWQLKVNPEFDIDWIVGHDEIAVPLGRKSDPGASLSMTMPAFRELIRKLAKEKGLR